MIVKYVRERGYQGEGKDPNFELGKSYLVHGVSLLSEGRSTMIGIQRDSDRTPVLIELKYFDVVDSTIPSDWCFFDFKNGCYALEHKEFCGDFWDRFHDGDEHAEKMFEQVLNKQA